MIPLRVYYGDTTRWDQARLERVSQALGRECDFFDGLEAVFEYPTKDEALMALLIVRKLDVRAEAAGVGEGPPAAAVAEARAIMGQSYDALYGPGGKRRP